MQHFKFVNWRIRDFVFWCHEQVIELQIQILIFVLWRFQDKIVSFYISNYLLKYNIWNLNILETRSNFDFIMRSSVLILVIFGTFLASFIKAEEPTLVQTPNGPVWGSLRNTLLPSFTSYLSFQGIPFASPPIGPLRLLTPKPPQPWTEPLDLTGDSKIICPQLSETVSGDLLGKYIHISKTFIEIEEVNYSIEELRFSQICQF